MNTNLSMGRFTLHQCMAAMALSGMVLAASMPTLNGHLMHVHREDARTALLKATQWMEKTATELGHYPEPRTIPPHVLAVESGRYVISVRSPNGLDFTLTATPVAAQADDECGAYRVDQAGTRLQIGTAAVSAPLGSLECWQN